MRSDPTINYIILGVVSTLAIIWVVHNVIVARRAHAANIRRKRRTASPSGSFEKDDTLQKSLTLIEGGSSKPYKDETLYNILKNSHLSSQQTLFNLNYLLDEMLSYLKIHYRAPGLEILFNIDADVPVMLKGTPGIVSQILINLFEHAVLASKIGIIVLSISVLKRTEKEIGLQFKIVDSDRKANQAELEIKFADPMVSGTAKLGLHVSKLLVEALYGQMLVSAVTGRGNEITFDLLFKQPGESEQFVYPKPLPSVAQKRVLIIDRDPEASILLRKLLINFMPKVVMMQASEFEEHSGKLDGDWGLVIIDQKFLKRQNVEALRLSGSVNIVVSEGLFDEPQHQLPVDYHLSKPFTLERIIEMLVIFYGSVPQKKPDALIATEPASVGGPSSKFFCDVEIEPTPNIRSDDFADFAGAKVMIVEDNEINQRVIKGLLSKSGIEIEMAENGIDALKKLPKVMPLDMILMDINMPELDGLETTRRIRADRRFETLPIIAFTGLNLADEIQKMEEAGMNAQMAKPLNAGKFYTVFSTFLGARQA